MPNIGTTITVTFHEGDKAIYQHAVKDFPDGMLEAFQERVFRLWPNDKDAPAKFLAEAVASMCEADQRTLLINGIPAEYLDAAVEVTAQAETTVERLVIHSINAAHQDKLHVVRLANTGEKETESHFLILTGIPEACWKWFQDSAKTIADAIGKEFTAENMVGLIFQDAHNRQLKVEANGNTGGQSGEAATFTQNQNG